MNRNYDENALLLESSGIALLINIILRVYTFEFVLHHRFSAILVMQIIPASKAVKNKSMMTFPCYDNAKDDDSAGLQELLWAAEINTSHYKCISIYKCLTFTAWMESGALSEPGCYP